MNLLDVLSPLLGGVGGVLARSIPEFMQFFKSKAELKHELAMQEYAYKFAQLTGSQRLQELDVSTAAAQVTAAVDAVKEAYNGMGNTGIKFFDGLNASVRPVITYVIFSMWVLVKYAAYTQLTEAGLAWSTAVTTMWGQDDAVLLSGVSTFYFMSRVFAKIKL